MPARRNATSTRAGILRPEEFVKHAAVERVPCATELAPWVENHWCLRWDLPAGTSYSSQTLPHPACNVSVELGHPRAGLGDDRVVVTGVITRRFDVELVASGWVLGVKFRPGGLAALAGVHARALADRSVPAIDLLPASAVTPLRSLTAGTAPHDAATVADAALLDLVDDQPDPGYDTVLRLVDDMLADRTLLRVDQLEDRHDLSKRRLERLFARYVGVGPKWVLARYRMHDVVDALDGGYAGSLADLAATYGWYDQAHFGRDFTALVGVSPSTYRESRSR